MPAVTSIKFIRADRVINGLGGPAQEGVVLILEESRVSGIYPSSQVPVPEDAPVETYDFQGGTVLPGLIDCHTHTNMPGDGRTGEEVDKDSDDVRLARARHNVRKALETGVTTLCDNGSWNSLGFSLKKEIQTDQLDGPDVLACGRPITKTKGHCGFMGSEAEGIAGVGEAANHLLNEGADFLKVMTTGGSTLGTDPFSPAYSQQELTAIVQAARRKNKYTVAHARCTQGIAMAVEAGFDMIAHCVFAGPDGSYRFDPLVAEGLAKRGVWVNPTLAIWRSRLELLKAKAEHEKLTPEEEDQVDKGERAFLERLDECQRLMQMGAKLVAGSDCGWGVYPFGFFVREIEALRETGLSPMEAILSGTSEAAKAVGISHRVGSLAPGKEADVVVVWGDPTKDVSALGQVMAVFKRGRYVAPGQNT